MTKHIPTPDMLRKLLRYEPSTRKLFWRRRSISMFSDGILSADHSCKAWNGRYADKEAFTSLTSHGYLHGTIFTMTHQAHRVIWAMETGAWPTDEIDHINGVRTDNRMENMRDVSNSENSRNMRISKRNTSGFIGISWSKRDRRWRARIHADGADKYLGTFAEKGEAIAAREAAEIKHNYHPNHGRA